MLTYSNSDVGCKTVANMIKGKTPEEIRKLFNIVNDFTPEEEVTQFCLLFIITIANCQYVSFFKGTNQEGKREYAALSHTHQSDSNLLRNGPRTVKRL